MIRLRETRRDPLRAFVQVRDSPFDSYRPERRGQNCFGTKRPPVQIRPPRPAHRPLAISVSGLLHGPSNCNPTTDPRNPYLDQGGARGAAGPLTPRINQAHSLPRPALHMAVFPALHCPARRFRV